MAPRMVEIAEAALLLFLVLSIQAAQTTSIKLPRQDLKLVENFQTSDTQGGQLHPTSRRHAASTEKDHAPKLIHQPQSILVQADKPHTIECAIEARPAPEIKWFKDNQLFVSQAPHSEQQNNELMFFQVNDDDTGTYHCEATNYLGTTISDSFKLTVQSSIHDPRLRLEPRQAEVGEDQQAEFTCTLPMIPLTRRTRQRLEPEVSWKRDGKKLFVKWLDEDEELADARSRFVARRLLQQQQPNSADQQLQFALTITRVQVKDDNSTFTCLYQMPSIYSRESDGSEQKLAHESSQARLRVFSDLQQPPPVTISSVNLPDPNFGPPLYDIVNKTTQLLDPSGSDLTIAGRRVNSLKQTLLDLFEIAKPTLIIFGILFLVSLFVMLKLIYLRHQKNRSQNRYRKHTSLVQQTYSVSSAGSGSSSGGGGAGGAGAGFGVDPMLNSLMARTLSAPNGAPLACGKANGNNNGIGGLSKKYRSYRDHMRKIGDKNNDPIIAHSGGGCDFLDANFVSQLQQQLQLESQTNHPNSIQDQSLEPFSFLANGTNISRPNLFNQSLAAREQARSLLQANEHMRSLSNLNAIAAIQQQQASCRFGNQNGSNLNLPLSFMLTAASRPDSSLNQLNPPSALWPNSNSSNNQQQQQNHLLNGPRNLLNRSNNNNNQQTDEHYQLVNCSSISPSSASSSTGTGGSSGNGTMTTTTNSAGKQLIDNRKPKESISSNHYSTIETNDDDEYDEGQQRYEQVDCHNNQNHVNIRGSYRANQPKVSSFVTKQSANEQLQEQNSKNFEDQSTRSTTNKRNSRQFSSKPDEKTTSNNSKFQDQLSPYAVSSICGNIPPPSKPPANSEAMRALNEQFDINQLMLLDEQQSTFDIPPPPPPPQADNHNNDS